jgi:hypothetical protein
MRHDTQGPGRSAFDRDFDACVIGTGPAGITLARALAAKGLTVALMEAGELEWTDESQALYAGEVTGHEYPDPDWIRLRYFGGTSGHWNGVTRPHEQAIFDGREQNPHSAWPIDKADLDPYEPGASEILDLPPLRQDLPWEPGDRVRQVYFRRSPPTRFGEKYLAEVTNHPRIFLGIRANLVDLTLDDDLGRVTEALFRSYEADDPGFTVRAQHYCLCTGGVENARLLLNFRKQIPQGIGNAHDQVGRFFCDHPSLELGEVILAQAPEEASTFFVPTESFLAENRTLPLSFRIDYRERQPLSPGKEALRSAECALPLGHRLAEALTGKAARCDTGGIRDYFMSRDPGKYPWGRVLTNAEQALNPASRIALLETTDAFGLNQVDVHWELSELDHRSIRLGTLGFAAHLAEKDMGRMRIYDWVLAEPPALPHLGAHLGNVTSWHHMCTTRMSNDPKTGVVDADCRVHGISNLHLGGSSVFSSPGYANPTYTIVQLALRLADHLTSHMPT